MFFTAISTVAITLFMVGFFLIIVYDVQAILSSVKSQVEVAVYLKDNATQEFRDYLESEIKSWEEVSEVVFISKEQALEKFKADNEGSDILKEIQGNPLPASFEIRLSSPEKVEQIALRFLTKEGTYIDGVDEVIYGQNYVQKLFQITAIAGSIAFLVIVMLLLAAIVLIYNTIRLSIHARRKEIEVMKLVGATNWFVRIPFLFEGFFEGVVGSIIAVIMLFFISNYLLIRGEKAIIDTLRVKELAILGSSNVILYIYAGIIILGGLIGLLSSSFALKRYIRV
ncbi:MAG: ABC transporter permease [Actinobacteria bacterium]|nr:ABC transporter permease [Actinomycetota bacterium]